MIIVHNFIYFIECNDRKCGTCISSPDFCVVACDESCLTCDTEGKCKSCKLGWFKSGQLCE